MEEKRRMLTVCPANRAPVTVCPANRAPVTVSIVRFDKVPFFLSNIRYRYIGYFVDQLQIPTLLAGSSDMKEVPSCYCLQPVLRSFSLIALRTINPSDRTTEALALQFVSNTTLGTGNIPTPAWVTRRPTKIVLSNQTMINSAGSFFYIDQNDRKDHSRLQMVTKNITWIENTIIYDIVKTNSKPTGDWDEPTVPCLAVNSL